MHSLLTRKKCEKCGKRQQFAEQQEKNVNNISFHLWYARAIILSASFIDKQLLDSLLYINERKVDLYNDPIFYFDLGSIYRHSIRSW